MSEDNNYGVRFKSKTEAIEQLCLKVFGAYPIYGSDFEDLEEETLESMYAKVVAVALDCDPIPAKDRADDKLEPPWEVFARVKRERDEAREQRDRLAEALRILRDEATEFVEGQNYSTCDQRGLVQTVNGAECVPLYDAIDFAGYALAAVKENQTTDSQSCLECDALASHGSNDGPCETHKL